MAALAYYIDPLKPLAHSLAPWILLTALCSARRRLRDAALRSTVLLASAVIVFYVGKKLVYQVKYPGMSYRLNATELEQWLTLALVAGCLLGYLFRYIGGVTPVSNIAVAMAVGFILADCYRGSSNLHQVAVLVPLALAASALLTLLAVRTFRDLGIFLSAVIPCGVIGLLVISLPDLVQQALLTGRL